MTADFTARSAAARPCGSLPDCQPDDHDLHPPARREAAVRARLGGDSLPTCECGRRRRDAGRVPVEHRQHRRRADSAARERFKVTKQIGVYKASVGLPPADPQREEQQIARLRALAASANLDPSFSEKFLRFVIDEVIRHHDLARNEAGAAGD